MHQELEMLNNLSLSSHQLLTAANQKVKYGCSMHCCFQIESDYALFVNYIKLTENYLLGYCNLEQNVAWGIELNLNVTVRVDEEKITPEKQLLTERDKVVKFRIHGLPSEIRLFSQKPQQLDLLCRNLSAKPIFWSGFKTKYKARRKIIQLEKAHYLSAVSLENSQEFLVKSFNLTALEDPERKEYFANEVQVLKKFNIPGIVKLQKVYQSDRTVYMVYEDPGKSLSQLYAQKFCFNQEGIKVFIKTILKILFTFHEKGIYHGNIHKGEIFFKKIEKTNEYVVKIGGFDVCGYSHYNMMNDLHRVGLILSEMLSKGPAEPHGQDLAQKLQNYALTTSNSLKHMYLAEVESCNLKLE